MNTNLIRRSIICLFVTIMIFFAPKNAFADQDFGKDAEENLRKIDEEFGMRIGGTEQHAKMQEWLLETIRSYGYEPEQLAFHDMGLLHDKYYDGVNIKFEKPGKTDETILVCAHYDCVDTNGAEDNGTGVSVLLELAKRFYNIETKYTIRFLLFDEEENCLVGSMYYAHHEDLSDVICACNLDCIGVGDDMYVYGEGPYTTDENTGIQKDWPIMQFAACANASGIPIRLHQYEGSYGFPGGFGMSDHSAFLSRSIPYVFMAAGYWTEGEATELLDTADPSVSEGRIIHNPEYDNLEYIEEHFGNRIFEHMSKYSEVATYFLQYADPYKSTDDVANEVMAVTGYQPTTESEKSTEPESNESTGSESESDSLPETETKTSEQNSKESSVSESLTESSIEVLDGDGSVQTNHSSPIIYFVVAGIAILIIFAVFFVIIRKKKK